MNRNLNEDSQRLLSILNKQMKRLKGNVYIREYRDNQEYVDKLLKDIFRYVIILRDDDGIDDFLKLKNDDVKGKYLENKIAQKLDIPWEDIDERKEEIYRFAYRNYVEDGFICHSTNSYYVSQIDKTGKFGGVMIDEFSDDVEGLGAILEKYDRFQSMLSIKKVQRKGFFYNEDASQIMYYSNNGPEWFTRFCGNCIDYINIASVDEKRAFERRDYETAKGNLEKYMDKQKYTDDDRQYVLDTFERIWGFLGKSIPSLLLIPKKRVDEIDPFEIRYENAKMIYGSEINLFSVISGSRINLASENIINADEIICVDILPLFPEIVKRLNLEEKGPIQLEKGATISDFKKDMERILYKLALLSPEERKDAEGYIDSLVAKKNMENQDKEKSIDE